MRPAVRSLGQKRVHRKRKIAGGSIRWTQSFPRTRVRPARVNTIRRDRERRKHEARNTTRRSPSNGRSRLGCSDGSITDSQLQQVSSSSGRAWRLATRAYVQLLTPVPTRVTTTTRNIAEPTMRVTASPAGTATAKPTASAIAHAFQSYRLRPRSGDGHARNRSMTDGAGMASNVSLVDFDDDATRRRKLARTM